MDFHGQKFARKYTSFSVIFTNSLAKPPVLRGKNFWGKNVQKKARHKFEVIR
jgi:hypothetical protein